MELIHGELREMAPIGADHEVAVDFLNEWSFESLSDKAVWVRVQNSVGVPELDCAPQPDLAWVARRSYKAGRPTSDDIHLIIEVAHSSLEFDRGEKAALYAAAGVKEYWIVNLVDRCVEVHREPNRGKYENVVAFQGDEKISPLAFPKV